MCEKTIVNVYDDKTYNISVNNNHRTRDSPGVIQKTMVDI